MSYRSDNRDALTYRGRPVTTMTRDELLSVVEWAYGAIAAQRRMMEEEREMAQLFRDARRELYRYP